MLYKSIFNLLIIDLNIFQLYINDCNCSQLSNKYGFYRHLPIYKGIRNILKI